MTNHWYHTASGLAALLLGLPAEAHGQARAAEDSLLRRLTTEAVSAAPTVLQRGARSRSAATRVRPAGALPDPMLTVGVMDLTLPRFAFRESDFTEVDVELSQQLPWPGSLAAARRAAGAMARGADAETQSLGRELTVRVALLYYRLRYVMAAQRTLLRQRSLLQAAVEISTARYGTGSVPQDDPLQARLALARLDTEEAALGAEEAGLRADLRAVRGIRGPERLAVTPILADSVAGLLVEAGARHAAQLSGTDPLVAHPRLEVLRAGIAAADQTARAEALSARPDFEVMARYGARPLGADFFSAFVGIRIPLWAGRKQRLLAQAARLDAEAARQGLEAEQAALAAELERTLADARAGAARLGLLVHRVLPVSREAVDAALRGYRTGQSGFLSVLTAQDARYRAELEAGEVAAEHLTHLVMLDQLLQPETVQ